MSPRDPLATRVEPVVEGIVRLILREELGRDDLEGVPHLQETAAVLLHRMKEMPPHLSTGMMGLTLFFDLSAAARGGRPFHQLDPADQARWFGLWRKAPGFFRNFSAFYEKLGAFSWYSLVEEAESPLEPD